MCPCAVPSVCRGYAFNSRLFTLNFFIVTPMKNTGIARTNTSPLGAHALWCLDREMNPFAHTTDPPGSPI